MNSDTRFWEKILIDLGFIVEKLYERTHNDIHDDQLCKKYWSFTQNLQSLMSSRSSQPSVSTQHMWSALLTTWQWVLRPYWMSSHQ